MSSRRPRRDRSRSTSPERPHSSKRHHHGHTNASVSPKHSSSSISSSSRTRSRRGHDSSSSRSRPTAHHHHHHHSDSKPNSEVDTKRTTVDKHRACSREHAELPSDHPLFDIVSKQREQKRQQPQQRTPSRSASRSRSRSRSPRREHETEHRDNAERRRYSEHEHHNRQHHHHRDDRYSQHRPDPNRRYGDSEHRRTRARGAARRSNRACEEDNGEMSPARDDEPLHGKFALDFHTGHKQQQLLKKKQEEQIEPQITAQQAQEIIAVTSMVQQQQQISEIVETQQRKLQQKTSLEKIKEKILAQKESMLARQQQHRTVTSHSHTHSSTNTQSHSHVNNPHAPAQAARLPPSSQLHAFEIERIDSAQRTAIENLAAFVKQHPAGLEQTVRDRSRNDPKFSWLYDEGSNGHRYYQFLLRQPQAQLQTNNSNTTMATSQPQTRRRRSRFSALASSASAFKETPNTTAVAHKPATTTIVSGQQQQQPLSLRPTFCEHGEEREDQQMMHGVLQQMSATQSSVDSSLHSMDAFMTKLKDKESKEEKKRDTRFDRSNQMSIHNGGSSHHIGHYLSHEELNKFNSAVTATNEHANELYAPEKKPWDPEPGDDAFTLYKKKMMCAYRHRPNPLNNPRKQYY